MIYESVITQLNNYKRLNNDGNGIELKEVPVVAKEYLDISAGDNIKLKSIQIEKNSQFQELNYKDEFTQCNLSQGMDFETVKNVYYIVVDNAPTYDPNTPTDSQPKQWIFNYIKNGEEKSINILDSVLNERIAITYYLQVNNNYSDIVNCNLDKIEIDVTDESNIAVRWTKIGVMTNKLPSECSAGQRQRFGLVPTPVSIFLTTGYIGAHTEFVLKYTNANNEEITSEPFNIALAYNNNQQS